MIIHDFEQGTDEWFNIRLGKFTATNGQAVATAGKGLDTLCFEKVAEIISGKPAKEPFTNPDLERGKEFEAIARANYEMTTGKTIKEVGFCELSERVGCSPDGLIDDDGLAEIKCQNSKNFIQTQYECKADSKYVWQMQFQMFVTNRIYCDFIVFNEHFDNYFSLRIERDEAKIAKIQAGIEIGKAKIDEIINKINKQGKNI